MKKNGKDWNKWTNEDWEKADNIWQRTVGGAQRLVPVHVANQYCRTDSSFNPPTFNTSDAEESLKGRRTVKCDYGVEAWFPLESQKSDFRLGIHFGVTKGAWAAVALPLRVGRGMGVFWELDLAAMTVLCKVRQKDLETLMERLLSPKIGMKF